MKTLVALTVGLLLAHASAAAPPTPPPAEIVTARLLDAWAHLAAAKAIAGGGAAQPLANYLKTGVEKSDAELRREIRIDCSGIATDLGTVAPLALVDVATHVRMARLKLTTDPPNVNYKDTRKRMTTAIKGAAKKSSTPVRTDLRLIEEAIGAL